MTPWLQDPDVTLFHGDCLEVLRELPSGSVHMCATSPPFYGLRDYGTGEWEGGQPDCDHSRAVQPQRDASGGQFHETRGEQTARRELKYATYGGTCPKCGARRVDQQIGLEETPDQWVANLVAVFREVRRVLRDDGTLWVEIGDSYGGGGPGAPSPEGHDYSRRKGIKGIHAGLPGLKPKDLLGQPWLLAFALRADGWWLRSEIIWARPNPMPESVTDRPTKSHSTVFLLSKQPRYFYDADAIREDNTPGAIARFGNNPAMTRGPKYADMAGKSAGAAQEGMPEWLGNGANARSVWTIPTQPTPYAHFATWPEALVRRMILAGTSERGCCPECGAPWVRDVERGELVREPGARFSADEWNGDARMGDHMTNSKGVGSLPPNHHYERIDKGWIRSCEHDATPVPCVVLDPFAGSATTNLVARNHGRHSIGIELNEDYLRIAAKRLQQLSLLAT